jgi:hypothetical protein
VSVSFAWRTSRCDCSSCRSVSWRLSSDIGVAFRRVDGWRAETFKSILWWCLYRPGPIRREANPTPGQTLRDRGGRNRSTGTCADPCRREAALGSGEPRSRGKSVVPLGPWDNFAAAQNARQFQNLAAVEMGPNLGPNQTEQDNIGRYGSRSGGRGSA